MSTIILDPVAVARIEREHGITLTPAERDAIIMAADEGRPAIIVREHTRYIAHVPLVRFPDDLISTNSDASSPWDLLARE